MSKLSKRSIIKNSGRDDWNEDYIYPIEDPSHPGYETALKRENDVYREFLKSQPKKEGKVISICPNCFKVFKEREVNINPLSEWAFKDGIATTKTSRGCPVCDPKNYDESKDPNSELAIAKQKEKIEKEKEEKREKNRLWWEKFNEDSYEISKHYKKHPELKTKKEEVPTIEEEYWADDKFKEKRSSLNEDLGKIFKIAEIQEQDNLGARLKEEELLEKKDFDPADITLVQHLKDSLKTLINSSQHLFELNLLTTEELNVIRTIEENMDDYLIAEQWSKMAKLKVFLKVINSNVRSRTILKLGQFR
jgi:hypothetical protein